MNESASALVDFISLASENAPIPYTIPKFTAFALLLNSEETCSTGILKTLDAVKV